nr:hypothetical protein [Tanacetum cinerariifolium]
MADHEHLHTVGVKTNAKIILIENLSTKNEDLENVDKIEEVNKEVEVKETVKEVSRGVEAVNKIRNENNQFAEQMAGIGWRALVYLAQLGDGNSVFSRVHDVFQVRMLLEDATV